MCFANLTLDAINFGIKNLERFANFVGQGVMGWFGKKDVGKLDLSGWMIENPERFTKSGEDAAKAYYGAYARTLFELCNPIDRKSVVMGMSESVRVDLGGSRIITKKKKNQK